MEQAGGLAVDSGRGRAAGVAPPLAPLRTQEPGDMGVLDSPPQLAWEDEEVVTAPGVHYDHRGRLCNRFCPVCQRPMHARKNGDWECRPCGAAGGTFLGKRLYMTSVPDSDEGRAAAARLAAQW